MFGFGGLKRDLDQNAPSDNSIVKVTRRRTKTAMVFVQAPGGAFSPVFGGWISL